MQNKKNINEAKEPLNGNKNILNKIDESFISSNSIDAALINATSIDAALINPISTNANYDSEFRDNKISKQISNINESTQKEMDKRKMALSKALRNNIKRRLIAQQQKD